MTGGPGSHLFRQDGNCHPPERYCPRYGRQLVSELHRIEDLFGEWKKQELHEAPLRYFYMEQILESVDVAHVEMEAAERPVLRSAMG